MKLLGLVLSTVAFVLPATGSLAAEAPSPRTSLVAQAPWHHPAAHRVVEGGLSLPMADRYEAYDPSTAQYIPVEVASVPWRVERGQWIYDRTAQAWVNHPSVGGRNPLYASVYLDGAAGRLVRGQWSLPVNHRYEVYDVNSGQYWPTDVASIFTQLERGTWIYDRTAETWVAHPTLGVNSNYLIAHQSGWQPRPRGRW